MYPVTSLDSFLKENGLKKSMSSIHGSNSRIYSPGHNISSGHSTSHSSLMAEKEGMLFFYVHTL